MNQNLVCYYGVRVCARGSSFLAQVWLAVSLMAASGYSQSPSNAREQEKIVELSPFVISTEGDEGYRAANTLAGTRLNSSLLETPAAITILTKELLDDMGAQTTEDFFRMATNTRFDLDNDQNAAGSQWYDAPAKIRGFGGATVTRDYFSWSLTSDVYNVERVDINRGPNAVLYGIGAPGGVLNTSSKRAHLNNRKKEVAFTMGSWGKKRAEVDFAFPLVKDVLALRANGVLEDRNGWREFEFFKQKGLALAGTYKPFRNTLVRADWERRIVNQLRPAGTPQDLGGTRWLAAGGVMAGNPLLPGSNPAPGLLRTRNIEQVMWAPQLRPYPFRISTIGADMRPDIAGTQASGFWDTVPGAGTLSQGQVDDPFLGTDVLPLRSNLFGPGATTDNDSAVTSIFLEQRIAGLNIELAYRHMEYWRYNRAIGTSGLIGDANPVLPGAYYANADSRIAAGRLPGTLLPDIGAPNPMAGQLFVEGQPQARPFDWDQDQYRATVGYELDLVKRNKWLGRHMLAAVWQRDRTRNDTWVERLYNIAPNNNQLIDSVTNSIFYRTYIDFKTPGGLHGAIDPWANPIDAPGVKSGFLFVGPVGKSIRQTDGLMVAGQSKFIDDRLVFTAGVRRDKVLDWRPTGGQKVPNSTNLYSRLADVFDQPATKFVGDTHTLGVVVLPFRWMGLSFNQADSVQPQTAVNPWNRQIGSRSGKGKDYGVRLTLLENRIYLNANYYQTDDANKTGQFIPQRTALGATIPAVIDTLRITGQPLPASMVAAGADTWTTTFPLQDTSGDGVEVELVGSVAKNWSVSLNVSRTNVIASNVGPFENAFIAEVASAWKGNATPLDQTPAGLATYVTTRDSTPGRDFTLAPATIKDAYEHAAFVVKDINRAEGQVPMQHLEDSVNLFTSYRFDDGAPALLRKSRIGIGCNYRSAPVIGYDANNGLKPILGRTDFIVNLMLGKSFVAGKGRIIDIQLNVQNLLAEEDMMPFNASVPGETLRMMYPQLFRNWTLKVAYRF